MPAHHLSDTDAVEDLTAHNVGDLNLWIGQRKEYRDVPNYVSNELCRRISPLPSVLELLPPTSLPVLQLLGFPTPQIIGKTLSVKAPSCLKVRLARFVLRRVLIEKSLGNTKDS